MGRAPYARLSEDRGKVSDSIANQQLEEQEYFERQGWPWDQELFFSDNDLSASKYSTKPRPGFLDLLDAIRDGRVELILVTEVSRLFRNLADAIELLALAKSTLPIRWVETTGGARFDLTTNQGEHDLLEAVIEASRESGKTSDRVRRNKRARAREGMWPGGSRPYGYRRIPEFNESGEITNRGKLVLVPDEAEVIRKLTRGVLAGESMRALAAELNARGVPTATGKSKGWSASAIRRTLASPRIVGVRTHHGTEYPGTWPAIISPEEHERLRLVLAERRLDGAAGARARSYLLTGFVHCGVEGCGVSLLAGRLRAGGEERGKRRYLCRRIGEEGQVRGCGKLVRLADPVELAVSEAVLARYESKDLASLLAPDAPAELHELAASLAADRIRLDEATRDRYRRKGDPLRLEQGQYLRIKTEIEDAMEMAYRRMARLEQGRALASVPPGMTLRQAWDTADLNWRRTILSLVVVKVILYSGYPGQRRWPADDSPLAKRAKALGGPWNFDPSLIDIEWKL